MAKNKHKYIIYELPGGGSVRNIYYYCVICNKKLYTDKSDWVVQNEKTDWSDITCSMNCGEILILQQKGILEKL